MVGAGGRRRDDHHRDRAGPHPNNGADGAGKVHADPGRKVTGWPGPRSPGRCRRRDPAGSAVRSDCEPPSGVQALTPDWTWSSGGAPQPHPTSCGHEHHLLPPSPAGSTPPFVVDVFSHPRSAGSCRGASHRPGPGTPSRWRVFPLSKQGRNASGCFSHIDRASRTSGLARPNAGLKPSPSPSSARRATATTTLWPRRSTRSPSQAGLPQENSGVLRRPRDHLC